MVVNHGRSMNERPSTVKACGRSPGPVASKIALHRKLVLMYGAHTPGFAVSRISRHKNRPTPRSEERAGWFVFLVAIQLSLRCLAVPVALASCDQATIGALPEVKAPRSAASFSVEKASIKSPSLRS